jgi:hypothetical protein
MLQALVESASWLVRDAQDFSKSLILLRRVRNVTYKSFVKPGNLLTMEVRCRRLEEDESDFEGTGRCNEVEVVKARFSLAHSRLSDSRPGLAKIDGRMVEESRALLARLTETVGG